MEPWYEIKIAILTHHEYSIGFYMTQYHNAVEAGTSSEMAMALTQAAYHANARVLLQEELDRWMPGGREIR